MISGQAKQAIDQIFIKAARSRLALDASDTCEIEPLAADRTGYGPSENIVVLTISSIPFRLLTIFHIDADAATRSYYDRGASGRPFQEMFYELANLCCGAMNQELLRYFPDLGMSTPYGLHGRCADFLGELAPGHISRHRITINGAIHMAATICVCENAPLDFALDLSAPEETTGELELF